MKSVRFRVIATLLLRNSNLLRGLVKLILRSFKKLTLLSWKLKAAMKLKRSRMKGNLQISKDSNMQWRREEWEPI